MSRYFHAVNDGIGHSGFYHEYVQGIGSRKSTRLEDPRFEGFRDCVAAGDGSHVPYRPVGASGARFRNYKLGTSLNHFLVCDLDGNILYVLAGYEGAGHDRKVLRKAVASGTFSVPSGKYVLGDHAYGDHPDFLTPFRGVRYHLKEWASANKRPRTPEELFNLRHASLRNVVERLFGVLKKRFKVLVQFNNWPIEAQITMMYSLAALHNFIRRHDAFNTVDLDEDDDLDGTSTDIDDEGHSASAVARMVSNRRNTIANDNWLQFFDYSYRTQIREVQNMLAAARQVY